MGKSVESGLAARMQEARSAAFVGRREELELFAEALAADVPPFAVLHVHGPGGVGKSTLLTRFGQMATTADRQVVRVDGRSVDPSPDGVTAGLAAALGVDGDAVDELAGISGLVLLIDTYELLGPIDGWLRDQVVPRLEADAIVVLGGRAAPTAGWRTDPAWSQLLQVVGLRDLHAEDARALLDARGVESELHDSVLRLAHGHPLALSLVAEALDGPDVPDSLGDAPEVIDALLEQLLRQIPSEAHRRALYAAAHVGIATQGLIKDTVEDAPADELFDWLAQRSFTEPVAFGVAVHDLVSEALNADLRWRDPDGWADLHTAVTRHLEGRLVQTSGAARTRAMLDVLQLYRHDPTTRRFFDWERTEPLWIEPARLDDHATIVELARQHEGETSAEIAAWWLERQPEAFSAFRSPGQDDPAGFVCHLLLDGEPGEGAEVDPVVAAAWEHVRTVGPLRSGERVRVGRFWVSRDHYQDVATHHLISVRASLDWMNTEGLAWAFVVMADTAFYEPLFRFIDFTRPDTLEVDVGDGHTVGMFARDFRATSKRAWRELLRDRRLDPGRVESAPERDRLLVLAEDEFTTAVRDALRGMARPGGLDDNPLLRSRVVRDHAGDQAPTEVLADLLTTFSDELAAHPRDEAKQRTLDLTYFNPAPTQEAAAERLDLPFSTFRRHLTAGIDHVVERLWELELHGSDGTAA